MGIGVAREYGEEEGLLEKFIAGCWFGVL